MPFASANGITLAYETSGDPTAPPLLLIQGLSGQLISWGDEFCAALAGRGYFLIRYDNRDAGLSTKFEGTPDIGAILAGDTSSLEYTLSDMAEDAAGLLDALSIPEVHVVGISMGGMIGQILALTHGARCTTLTSIMSTTGAPGIGAPSPEALDILLRPPAEGREAIIAQQVDNARAISSTGIPFDETRAHRRATSEVDRMYCPEGSVRQTAAILAAPDRTPALRDLTVPTLVIHGNADRLVGVSGGLATAEAVNGSELLVIDGMGHELPLQYQHEVVQAIAEHAGINTRRERDTG